MAKFLCITLAFCAVASASPILPGLPGMDMISGLTANLPVVGGLLGRSGRSAEPSPLLAGLPGMDMISGLTGNLPVVGGLLGRAGRSAEPSPILAGLPGMNMVNGLTGGFGLDGLLAAPAQMAQSALNVATGLAADKLALASSLPAAATSILARHTREASPILSGLPGMNMISGLTGNLPLVGGLLGRTVRAAEPSPLLAGLPGMDMVTGLTGNLPVVGGLLNGLG